MSTTASTTRPEPQSTHELRVGDSYQIRTRAMAASGTITKINPATVAWSALYMDRHPVSGKIDRHHFDGCLIGRGGQVYRYTPVASTEAAA